MKIKIKIPGELRAEILDCKASLESALADAANRDSALSEELSTLRAEETLLADQIQQLTQRVLQDKDASGQLSNGETRLRVIRQRIEALKETVANKESVPLGSAASILEDIVRFYGGALPDAIADLNQELFCQRHEALQAARMSEACRFLTQLRSQIISFHTECATQRNLDLLFLIFDRALRGQAHLGFDCTEVSLVKEGKIA